MSTSTSTNPSGDGEPGVSSKRRLPKSYTEDQLAFLRSRLGEFERRSQGSLRGDAKRFALEQATEFIVRFGLPPDVETGPDVDSEAKLKEVRICFFLLPFPYNHCWFGQQIYNWFKNTVGRTRRKAEHHKARLNRHSVDKGDFGRFSFSSILP